MDPLLCPALSINIPVLSKPISNPVNGEEYLHNAIVERSLCPETVTVHIDHKKIKNKQNVFAPLLPQPTSAPCMFIPTREWQDLQIANFSDARCRLSCIHSSRTKWTHSTKLPSIYTPESQELWNSFINNNHPHLSLVLTFKQRDLEYALNILIRQINKTAAGKTMDRECGSWLYAVLAALKLPLTPDVCSSLRELVRKCSEIRAKLTPDSEDGFETAAPLNLFICLVARYFRQEDLAD